MHVARMAFAAMCVYTPPDVDIAVAAAAATVEGRGSGDVPDRVRSTDSQFEIELLE